MSIITARDLIKDFDGHRALNGVSLEVPEGSVYGLLGPNGAGKTTLLRIINQIAAPDQGAVFFEGQPLKAEHSKMIGYLPEERGLYKKMKVGEQAIYLARLKGMSRQEANTKLRYWFEKFDIAAWWERKVEELSKGMAQKVQFITTVLHEPRLLIFDEPFSGFDPINVNLLKREILELRDKGATIIFSTHNMSSVEELCQHITLINRSEAVLQGDISDIRSRYSTNEYLVSFEGDSTRLEKNLKEGFSFRGMEENGFGREACIAVDPELGSDNLLRHLLESVTIKSFREKLPNMNDIFIRVVEEENKKNTGHKS